MQMAAAVIEPYEPMPIQAADPEQWALAYTHPREEFRAKESLEAGGFAVYLPTTHVWKQPRIGGRRSSKLLLCEVPRYDRYLFVGLAEDMRWRKIMLSRGVASLITLSTGVPALLPRKAVDLVRAQVAAEPKPEVRAKRPEWKPGDLLAVLSGIYAQHRVTFDGWEGEQCRVFITIFGRTARGKMDPKLLSSL